MYFRSNAPMQTRTVKRKRISAGVALNLINPLINKAYKLPNLLLAPLLGQIADNQAKIIYSTLRPLNFIGIVHNPFSSGRGKQFSYHLHLQAPSLMASRSAGDIVLHQSLVPSSTWANFICRSNSIKVFPSWLFSSITIVVMMFNTCF